MTLLHRNTSASSVAALMKQFDLNQSNVLDFPEFVLFMQSLPESVENIVEAAVQSQAANQLANAQKQIESHTALVSVSTQSQLLSISVRQSTVIAGAQTGLIFIWDLEASALLMRCRCHCRCLYSHAHTRFRLRKTACPKSVLWVQYSKRMCRSSAARSLLLAHPMASSRCGT